jgi:hypothetical protein
MHLPLSKYDTVSECMASSLGCRCLWLRSCSLTSVHVLETRLRHKPLIYHPHSPLPPLSVSPLWSTGAEFCNNGHVPYRTSPHPRTADAARKRRYRPVLQKGGTVCACLSVSRKLLTYGKMTVTEEGHLEVCKVGSCN